MENPLWVSLVYCWPGPPSGLGTGCGFVPSLSAECGAPHSLHFTHSAKCYSNIQCLHTIQTFRVKRTSYSWEQQAVCISPHIWVLHTAYPLSLQTPGVILTAPCIERVTPPWHWNWCLFRQHRDSEQQKWENLVYFCIKIAQSFPASDPQCEDMDWI